MALDEIVGIVNSDPELPLNERPTTTKLGGLSSPLREDIIVIKSTDSPSSGKMFASNGELFLTWDYRDYNDPQTHYLATYKDGKLIQQISSYNKDSWSFSTYVTRDKTTNNICACGSIINRDFKQVATIVNGKENVLTTLEKMTYFIYVFSPFIIYFDDSRFYKKNIITNDLLTVSMPQLVVSRMIWEHKNYVYYVGTDGNIYRFNVDTLIVENFTQINDTIKVVIADIDTVCYCANGDYIILAKSNNFLIYTVDSENGIVELIKNKIDVRFMSGGSYGNNHNLALMNKRIYIYLNMSPNSDSSIELRSNILVSYNDSKKNIFLTKGNKILTNSPLNKLSPNKLSYIPFEGNEIMEDGVYALQNTDDYYTVV